MGNSIVADPAVHPKAFDWQAAFPEVFKAGGFRRGGRQPALRPARIAEPDQALSGIGLPRLSRHGRSLRLLLRTGARLLKPGGLLSFVVTNKWMKSGYARAVAAVLCKRTPGSSRWWTSGTPSRYSRKPTYSRRSSLPVARPTRPKPDTARLCTIPREQLRIDDLSRQIEREGVELPLSQLGADAWQLEPAGVNALLGEDQGEGVPLAEFAGVKPYRGIMTGFNDAFLIDTATRNALVAADPKCDEVIRPYVRGQDIDRWASDWAGLWMIVLKSSGDYSWPWSDAGDKAEAVFQKTYPSIHARFKPMEDALRKRQDKGRHWWELRSCAYWDEFEKPKIVYQEIQFHPATLWTRPGNTGTTRRSSLPPPIRTCWPFSILRSCGGTTGDTCPT